MNHNDTMDSSPTLALTGLNVVIEDENDFVFISEGDLNEGNLDIDEWDDESYDHCDISPSLSCATSVATNITLRDLNLIEDSADDFMMPTMAILEASSNGGNGNGGKQMMSDDDDMDTRARKVYPPFMVNPKTGRRLCNKKLRKKMKIMKRAAAAQAAAEAFANQAIASGGSGGGGGSLCSSSTPLTSSSSARMSNPQQRSPKRKPRSVSMSNSTSIAVACAHQSLAAYREEIEAGKTHQKQKKANMSM